MDRPSGWEHLPPDDLEVTPLPRVRTRLAAIQADGRDRGELERPAQSRARASERSRARDSASRCADSVSAVPYPRLAELLTTVTRLMGST